MNVDGAVDVAFALRIVDGLVSIGSSDLGFRVAGTPDGARAPGAWIATSVEAARLRAVNEAQARLDRVAAGLEHAAGLLEAAVPVKTRGIGRAT
jgi:hypothetical protein